MSEGEITCGSCGHPLTTYIAWVRTPGYWTGYERDRHDMIIRFWERGKRKKRPATVEYRCPLCKGRIGREAIAAIKKRRQKAGLTR